MSWKDTASKLNSKYGLDEQSKKPSSKQSAGEQGQGAAGSRWRAAAAQLEEKYSPEKRQERVSLANDWMDRYSKVITGLSEFEQKRNGGYVTDVGGGYGEEIEALLRDFGGIEDAFSGLELRDARRQEASLRELRKKIADGNQFLSQFESEDAYNQYMAEWEDYEAKRTADIGQLEQELEALEGQYRAGKSAADQYQSIYDGTPRLTQKRNPEAYEALRQKGSAALKADIAERKAFLREAQAIQQQEQWTEKYGDKSYQELKAAMEALDPAGEEYRFAASYAESAMGPEDYTQRILHNTAELSYLEEGLREIQGLADQINMVGETEAYSKRDQALAAQAYSKRYQELVAKYGTPKELGAKIQELEGQVWEDQRAMKYGSLRDNADYGENSKPTADQRTAVLGIGFGTKWVGVGDPAYDYINNLEGIREVSGTGLDTNEYAAYDHMTPEEIADYNYLYNTQGKKAAQEYLEYLEYSLHGRQMNELRQSSAEFTTEHPRIASALSIPMNLLSGLGTLDIAAQNAANAITGEHKPVDYNSYGMVPTVASSTIRGTRAQNLADKYGTIQLDEEEHPVLSRVLNGKSLGDVYQLGMSMADSGTIALLAMAGIPAGVGTTLLGGSAASQGILDAVDAGATDSQALAMGILNGTFEALAEKVPLEKLIGGNSGNIVRDILEQSLTEGSEELITTLANTVADVLVMAEKSDYATKVTEYESQGMSRDKATLRALEDIAIGMGWDFAGGALSGGLMRAGSYVPTAMNRLKNGSASQMDSSGAQSVQGTAGKAEIDRAARGIQYRASEVNTAILDLVDRVKKGLTKGDERVQLTPVSDANAARIQQETGVDVHGFRVAIEARQIQHILKRHGENGTANNSMADPTDLAKIEFALRNPDSIVKSAPTRAYITNENGKMKPANTVLCETMLEDGSYYVVQAVPDTKKKTLYVLTAFIGESGYQKEASAMPGSVDPGDTPKAESPRAHSGAMKSVDINENEYIADASTGIVKQTRGNVNGNLPYGQLAGQEDGGADTQQTIHNLEGRKVEAAVSEDGKTRIVSTGQEAEIGKIASIRDGEITFQMEDGSLVDAGDIAYSSEGEAILYDAVASLGVGPMMANVLVQGFETSRGISAAVYAKGMQDAFRYGKWGAPMGEMDSGVFTRRLTQQQRKQAYEIGRMVAAEEAKAKQALKEKKAQKGPGKVHFDGDRAALTGRQRANMQALDTIADALGVQIYVFESETAPAADGEGTVRIGDNGWYEPSNGSIHIDLYAGADGEGTMLFTAAHELTHLIKNQSPVKFQALSDFLMEQYGKRGVSVRALVEQQMAKARKHGRELDYDGAFEEVVADSMESMLADGKVLQALRQRDRGLWQKVKDYVLELCRKVREAYKGLKPDSLEGRMVAEMKDAAEEMRRLFVEGLVDAGENFTGGEKNTTREGGVKYSLREFQDGTRYVDVQESPHVLDGLTVSEMNRKVKAILTERFVGKVIGIDNRVFVNGDSVNEYLHPSKSIDMETRTAKLTAAGELDNLLDAGKPLPNEADGRDGHVHPDTIDFSYFKTIFKVGEDYFEGIVNVKNIKRGKLLKDVTKIRNITEDIVSSYGKNPKSNFLRDASMISIRNAETDVKKKFSAQESIQGGQTQKNTTRESGVKYSIRETTDGRYVAVVDDDVLSHIDTSRWNKETKNAAKKAAVNALKQFRDGIVVDGITRKVNKTSIREFTRSRSTEALFKNQPDIFADKMRTSDILDDVIVASTDWSRDGGLKHPRADNFEDFDHGKTLIQAGNNRYSAEVVVGITSNGDVVFYDVVNMVPVDFEVKRRNPPTATTQKAIGDMLEGSSASRIAQETEEVKKKFSLRDQDVRKMNAVLEKQNEKLREDVASLKELLKLQKSVTGGKVLDRKSVDTAARFLIKNAGAKGNTAELSGLLNDVYTYMAGDAAISWEGIMERAQPAADWIAAHTETKQQLDPYGAEVLRELRGSRISLDESQRAEAEYQFGSVNTLRKQLFGTVTITDKDAVSLDSKWAELSELYPDVFDANTPAADMPSALLDAIDSLKNMGVSDMWYDQEAARQDLLQQIYDVYWRVSTLHTVADVKQKQITKLKGEHFARLNQVKTQYQEAVRKLKAEHRADMKRLREDLRSSSLEKQAEIRRQYQQAREKSVEGRNRTAMRHKVQRVVKDLNELLLNGTKEKHVPIELQKAVAEALDAVNMDTVGAEQRIARLEEKLLKAETTQEALEISRTIDRVRAMGDSMKGRLQALKAGYEAIIHSDDPLVAGAYDSGIAEQMTALMAEVGDTPLRDMSLRQLEAVHDVYTMVLTTIRNANKTFKTARNATVQELSQKVMGEVRKAGGSRKYSTPVMDAIRKFGWNNLKPVYVFEFIGSDTFKEIFKNVRKGEDIWAVDVNDASDFYLEQVKKYGYNLWDMGRQYEFTSTTGAAFRLSLPQIMSLYAYSKREQAADHLRKGGIVIDESTEVSVKTKLGITMKFNPTEATAYNISDETLTEIVGKLTKEQKAFVDAMQEYLSTVMGEKGNEVSLQMYGIKLFGEKNYFPLKSAQQYLARAKEQQQGDRKIKNAGFSKQTVRHAGNPVVLGGFMDVWAEHVNEMSMYHAFVLPMEDFYRVWGYSTGNVETEESRSVNAAIQNAYGKGATAYIDQLLKDLNGGARMDTTAGVINKSMNLFKKGAVFASMSVVIQQPSAIGRALSMIDAKYFAGPRIHRQNHQNSWQELKKYAPVAAIKEMGYFDTNMGKSTTDYILGQEYEGVREKAKAFFTDSGYRDEALSRGAALADEITWCNIWEAVKRETRAKHPGLNVRSEAFLQMAGERFTDVIVKTQVYDSVLSRSANMRSKDTGMKMATAFMAEPTTSINMVADALMKGKREGVEGRRYCRRAIGSVVAAQILNSILVSFVYAARDDDEDKTYLEKYLGAFVGGLTDSLNPATYIPFAKDIVSIVQGYDVERSDMAVVSDLWNAWKQLDSDHLTGWRKVENFAGSVCQIFGLPVKNIMRDARGMYQAIDTFTRGQKTTLAGLKYAMEGAVTGEEVSDREQLYRAYLSGDEDHLKRVRGRYDGEDSYNAAMRMAIREHFLSGDIDEAAAGKYLVKYGAQDGSEAHWIVDEWKYAKANGTSEGYGKYDRFYTSVRTGKDLKAVIQEYADNGVSEYTLSRQITTYFKPMYVEMAAAERAGLQEALTNALELCGMERDAATARMKDWDFEAQYGFSYDDRKQAYMDGKISGDQLQEILIKESGYEKEEAAAQVEAYEWEKLGFESVTASRVEKYNTYCKNAGVPREAYMKIMEFSADTHNDVDENGKTIKYSAVRKIMTQIDSLPIPDTQKEAIAHCFGWKEQTIQTYRLW